MWTNLWGKPVRLLHVTGEGGKRDYGPERNIVPSGTLRWKSRNT